MGLNPAIILLSLSVWGALFGFIGLIIALPLTTLLLSYYNRYIVGEEINHRKRRKLNFSKIKLTRIRKNISAKDAQPNSSANNS